MSETVVDESTLESPAPEPTTPPEEDIATVKKRLAGKDQALTKAQADLKAALAEAEALRQFKLETEQANMTEVQKLQAELSRLQTEAVQAKAEAQRARLAAKFPLAVELLGDAAPLDEDRLSVLEERLSKATAQSDDEPTVLADSPRKTPVRVSQPRDKEAAMKDLVAAGNPHFSEDAWLSTGRR